MPYESKADLPKQVKDNLPEHAQDIYKEAFNSAWQQYADQEARREDRDREGTAHAVAWAAVKKEYHKEGDQWVRDR